MQNTTNQPTVKITDRNSYTIKVTFKAAINKTYADVVGQYNIDTNVFYPELVDIFSVEQYARDIAKCDAQDLYEALQNAYENRDC